MPNRAPELVLRLVAEGGMLEIFRQLDLDGSWRFTEMCMGSGGFDIPDFAEETSLVVAPYVQAPPVHTPPTSFVTIEDAITNSSGDGSWVRWMVFEIHPEYVQRIWQFRERTIEAIGEQRAGFARRQDGYWADACGYKLPTTHPLFNR